MQEISYKDAGKLLPLLHRLIYLEQEMFHLYHLVLDNTNFLLAPNLCVQHQVTVVFG
jgi:hypothetical protein